MSKKKDYIFSYKKSGVDVELGNKLVKRIKPIVSKTNSKNVIGGIGGFGAVFEPNLKKYKKPLLVSATDGVGTKILIAKEMNNYSSIGIDLVAMSVNDIVVQGAKPLFFLDYIAVEKIKEKSIIDIVKSIAKGCLEAQCSLVGGETAELPGLYSNNNFDLAGFCLGIVEKKRLLPKKNIAPNDIILGLPSNGLHSNGFSLIRKIIKEKKVSYNMKLFESTLGKKLLKPTKIYVNSILKIYSAVDIKAAVHITGGGIWDNLKRVLEKNQGANIDVNNFSFDDQRSIYFWLNNECRLSKSEMLKTFNCGIGMLIIVSPKNVDQVINFSKTLKQPIKKIGIINSKKSLRFTE